jgi:hypothetical protein
MMEVVRTSETSVYFNAITRCDIPKGRRLQQIPSRHRSIYIIKQVMVAQQPDQKRGVRRKLYEIYFSNAIVELSRQLLINTALLSRW